MKNATKLIILNAIFFACAMLIAAYFSSSKEQGLLINNFLIALWFACNSNLSKGNTKKSC